MIPRRIAVEGFLCYGKRQVIDLDRASLWVFAGQNGSGKSSIFDAITFALYGTHRDGSNHHKNLINVHSHELRIEYDFAIGPDTYRIKKTVPRKGISTRQIEHHEVDDGAEFWTPVPETHLETGFNAWIAAMVGMNEKLFTTSVYLQQGGSDRFLLMTPAERFKIVAEVADILPYQRLHQRAEDRRRVRRFERDNLQKTLQDHPPIDPAAIADAVRRLACAQETKNEATRERDRLVALVGESQRWAALVAEQRVAHQATAEAQAAIAAVGTVERDWARLQELDAALPIIRAEQARRASLVERVARVSALRERQMGLTTQLDGFQNLADQSRQHLEAIHAEIERAEARRSEIHANVRELEAPRRRAHDARSIQRRITTHQDALAGFPANLAEQAEAAIEAVQVATEWKTALPLLTSFAQARQGWIETENQVRRAVQTVIQAENTNQQTAAALPPARVAAAESRRAFEIAERARIEATTHAQLAGNQPHAFERLRGASACDQCGQPLTPEHRAAEAARLRARLEATDQARQAAEHAAATVRARCEAAEAAYSQFEAAHQQALNALANAHRRREQAEADAQRHEQTCRDLRPARRVVSRGHPPRPERRLDETTYPTSTDHAQGERIAADHDRAVQTDRHFQQQLEAQRGERRQLATAQRELDETGFHPDDVTAEADHGRLAAEDDRLEACLRSHRRTQASGAAELDHLMAKRTQTEYDLGLIPIQLQVESDQIEAAHQESAAARAALPSAWITAFDHATSAELDGWRGERDRLDVLGLPDRIAALPAARRVRDRTDDRLATLTAELEAITPAARVDPTRLGEQQAEADARWQTVEAEVRRIERDLDECHRRQAERADLAARKLAADRALGVAEHLAELLGRTRLQRSLIRHAEEGILAFASEVLRTVSGDDLELRLRDDPTEDDQALDLAVIDRTHGAGRTIGVSFLSGSQKFRVAVSLAIGIGRYARGLNRPIQAVIIDEGFGSLDRTGLDEMKAQLKALRGCLDRIILVSHQEEFADAFPDGYRFQIDGDQTVVEEFHR